MLIPNPVFSNTFSRTSGGMCCNRHPIRPILIKVIAANNWRTVTSDGNAVMAIPGKGINNYWATLIQSRP